MESEQKMSKLYMLWVAFMGSVFAPAVYSTQFLQGRAFTPEGRAIINSVLGDATSIIFELATFSRWTYSFTSTVFDIWSYIVFLVSSCLPEGTKFVCYALKFATMHDFLVFIVIAAASIAVSPPSRIFFKRSS